MDISIIITCYNRQEFISRAIRSAVDQKYDQSKFEIIVVDDGSSDSSVDIINSFKDSVIPCFHGKNLGLPSARNSGIRISKGRYVINLDSDDVLHNKTIEKLSFFLNENHHWHAVTSDYYEFSDEDYSDRTRRSFEERPIACGVMFRKDVLIKLGLYNEKFLYREEEELLSRFLLDHKLGHSQLPLYRYRKHSNNMSDNTTEMTKYQKLLKE